MDNLNDHIEKTIEKNIKNLIDENRFDDSGFIRINIRDINTIAFISAIEGYQLGYETARNIYDGRS